MREWLLASSSTSRDPAHRQPENSQWLLRCRANQKSPLYQGPKKIKFQKRLLGSYLNTDDDKSQCPKPCLLNHDHMDRQTSQDGFRGLKSCFRLLMGQYRRNVSSLASLVYTMSDVNELRRDWDIGSHVFDLTLVANGLICNWSRNFANMAFIRIFMPGIGETVVDAWNCW